MQQARQNMADNADQIIEAEKARRVLWGPAGDYLYGPLPDRERMTDLSFQGQWEASKADFMDTLRNPFGKQGAAASSADAAGERRPGRSSTRTSARNATRRGRRTSPRAGRRW